MDKKEQGRKNKVKGKAFEDRVYADLEKKNWVVSRWMKNVELTKPASELGNDKYKWNGKLIPAKPSIRMTKTLKGFAPVLVSSWTGFPDFIAYKVRTIEVNGKNFIANFGGKTLSEVTGVECKLNGKLDKEEKEKCKWLLENNIFSKILITSKDGRKIKYEEWKT